MARPFVACCPSGPTFSAIFSLVINLLLLMCVAFIPFPTALIARYGRIVPVVILFGLTMAITGMLFSALARYSTIFQGIRRNAVALETLT